MSLIHEVIKFGGFTGKCNCSGENSGSSGGGTGGGATSWEDLGVVGERYTDVLPRCNPEYAGDMMYIIPNEFTLMPGKEYTVYWGRPNENGVTTFTEYKCTAEAIIEEGLQVAVALGNTAQMGGAQETEDPFIIAGDLADVPGMIFAFDSEDFLAIYIEGPEPIINPIPGKYLPNNPLVVHFTGTTADDITVKESFEDVYRAALAETRPVSAFLYIGEDSATAYNLDTISETNLTFSRIAFIIGTVVAYELVWYNDGRIEVNNRTLSQVQ